MVDVENRSNSLLWRGLAPGDRLIRCKPTLTLHRGNMNNLLEKLPFNYKDILAVLVFVAAVAAAVAVAKRTPVVKTWL